MHWRIRYNTIVVLTDASSMRRQRPPSKLYFSLRSWRNWQTRTFEGRVSNHPGSSPGGRTMPSSLTAFEMVKTTRIETNGLERS